MSGFFPQELQASLYDLSDVDEAPNDQMLTDEDEELQSASLGPTKLFHLLLVQGRVFNEVLIIVLKSLVDDSIAYDDQHIDNRAIVG